MEKRESMKGYVFLLLLLVGMTLAIAEGNNAGKQRNVSSRSAEKGVEHSEQLENESKSGFKFSARRPHLHGLRQRQSLRETQKRQRYSAAATRNAWTQFQEKAQSFFHGESGETSSSTSIPLQQHLDRIQKLPGQPDASFAQYGGYVTVNDTVGRALYYYFVEATEKPDEKPIVLWLNGGPGCSSLAYGAWEELGPFRVKSDGYTLYRNNYAWNKFANIIFLESPAGVGFSYSNNTQDYYTAGDTKTSYDSLIFLIRWFERFPQYKYRDFYIAGESYGGHYVPQLSKRVYDFNQGQANPVMNFKGFLIGNPVIDSYQDTRGGFEYWWSHALISDETYAQLQGCVSEYSDETSTTCDNVITSAYNEQGNIDPYDIYTPSCLRSDTINERFKGKRRVFRGYDPCMDYYVYAYMNRPDVQEALHANITRLSYDWEPCSDPVNEHYSDVADSVIPILDELNKGGVKIWVMSGDVDSVVPVTGTRYSLQLLKLKTTVPWYAWYHDNQVGGFTQGYGNLSFVTVRDAGHEVPLFQPARALVLFKSYITGEPLPKS